MIQLPEYRLNAVKHIFESYLKGFTDTYELKAYLKDIEYQIIDLYKSNNDKSLCFKFSSDDTTIETIDSIISDIKGPKQNKAYIEQKIKYGLENNSIRIFFS